MHQGLSSLNSSKISLQQSGGVLYAPGSNLVQASRDGEVNILLALANSLQIFDAGLGYLIGSFYEVREVDSGNPNSRKTYVVEIKVNLSSAERHRDR